MMSVFHSVHSLARIRRVALLSLLTGLALTCLPVSQAAGKIGKQPKDSVARRQLTMLDGSQHSLMALRGKVVVLNFFAVWCGHSRDQVATLTKLSDAESSRGLQVVGLAVEDDRTNEAKVRSFVSDHKINYPTGMVNDPVFMEYVSSRMVDVPQTLVYGRDGRLVAHYIGQNTAQDAALEAAVRQELDKQ